MKGLSTRVWALMPLAVALNLVMSNLVALLKPLPLYLDSVGTVLVGALCGPGAGAITGIASIAVVALTAPTFFPFMLTAAVVGALSGWLGRRGIFATPGLAAAGGLFLGVAAALVSAPISAYLFGGVTGGGTDLLVAYFRGSGRSALESSLAQGLISDPLDKLVSLVLVQLLLAGLPESIRNGFPEGHRLAIARRPRRVRRGSAAMGARPRENWGASVAGEQRQQAAGWLQALTPLTKLLGLVVAVVMAIRFAPFDQGTIASPLPLLAFGLFGLGLSSGVGTEVARVVGWFWTPLALSMTLINGLFGPAPRSLWHGIAYSPDGLAGGLGLALRVLVILLAVALVLATTQPAALAAGLEEVGLPPSFCYVVLAALSLAPGMARRLEEVRCAQAARGLYLGGSALARLKSLVPLLGPALLSVLAETEQRAMALEARGFGASRRRTRMKAGPRGEWPVRLALLAAGVWALC